MDGVFGLRSMAHHPQGHGVEKSPVALQQDAETRGVTPLGQLDEFRIAKHQLSFRPLCFGHHSGKTQTACRKFGMSRKIFGNGSSWHL